MQSVGKIIAEHRKKKKLSQKDLVSLLSKEGIKVTVKAVSKWETDATEPGAHAFLTTCRILGVKDIFGAYFGNDLSGPLDGLNQEEHNFLNGLNQKGKDKVKEYAEILKASGMFNPQPAKVIPIRKLDIYYDKVSAGTGNFLTDSLKESYEVGDLAPDNADFGVRVSGDSMEPEYHNGDVVWVQHKENLSSGEIGIFVLNGNAYIKKLHDEPNGVFLVSLNEKYAPIAVLETDSLAIFGKVVGKCQEADIQGLR